MNDLHSSGSVELRSPVPALRDRPRWLPILAASIALAAAPPVLAQPAAAHASTARDVTPDVAFVFGNTSEAFAFHGQGGVLVTAGRSGFHRSESRGARWKRSMNGFLDASGVEPFALGLCQAPSLPDTVYAATIGNTGDDRLFRTDDFGETWRPLALTEGVGSIDCAVDPGDHQIVYYLTAGVDGFAHLLKSTDGGSTFVRIGAGLEALDGPVFVRVAPTDPRIVYVGDIGTVEGLYVSGDGGATFVRLDGAPAHPAALRADPVRNGTLYVAGDGGLSRSVDGGQTFSALAGLPSTAVDLTFDPGDTSVLYVAAGLDGVYRSDDGGSTFFQLSGPSSEQLGHQGALRVGCAHPRGTASSLYLATAAGPHRSDDGGQTFTPIASGYHGATVEDLAFDAAGRLLVGVFHTVVAFRADGPGGDEAYQAVGDGVPVAGDRNTLALATSPVDPGVLVVVIAGDGVYRTGNGGGSWTKATIAGDPTFVTSSPRVAFAPSDASRVYLVTVANQPGFYRSVDGGRSFELTFEERLGAIAVDPANADVVYVGTWDDGGGLFKSTDGGLTFQPLGVPGDVAAIAIDPFHSQTIYVGRRGGGVLRSLDGGATWDVAAQELPGGEVLGVGVDPRDPTRVFVWIKAGGLFSSEDGGVAWAAMDVGEALRRSGVAAGRATLAVDPVHSGRVYLGNSGLIQVDAR